MPANSRNRFDALAIVAGATMSACFGGQNAIGQTDNSTAYWPRKDFVIPFQLDPAGEVPKEVRLEVSLDEGQTWQLHQRVDVRTRQFRYQASRDGEYLFRLKTVDSNGNVFDNPGEPMKVVVDTTKPTGELVVDMDSQGSMQTECRITDAALDPSSLQLEFQTDLHPQWMAIPFQAQRDEPTGSWVASGTWELPAGASQLLVRATVRDRAGNTAEWNRMPRLPRSAKAGRDLRLASQSGILRVAEPPSNLSTESQSEDVPRVEVRGKRSPRLAENMPESQRRASEHQNRLLMQQRATARHRPVATPVATETPPQEPTADVPEPPATPASLPDALHSNHRVFSLDYSIDHDPGSNVSTVELWGTTDHGESWQKWGTDTDRESPFDIEVADDGLFGFTMVIVGVNGVATTRPLPGDAPDAWVRVDTVAPQAQIVSALHGKGVDAGSVVIEYQAIDDFFGERPISFSWSATPQGPWQPLAQGARNHGRYTWIPEVGLPPRVYLRIEAVDAAGNVTAQPLDLPVDIQGAAPRGRIQGVRPQR